MDAGEGVDLQKHQLQGATKDSQTYMSMSHVRRSHARTPVFFDKLDGVFGRHSGDRRV